MWSLLREEYRACCEAAGEPFVTVDALARYWRKQVSKGPGDAIGSCRPAFDGADQEAIAPWVANLVVEMDLKCSGRVDIDDWIHHAMLADCQIPSLQVAAPDRFQGILQKLPRESSKQVPNREVPNQLSGKLPTGLESSAGVEELAGDFPPSCKICGQFRTSYESVKPCWESLFFNVFAEFAELSEDLADKSPDNPWRFAGSCQAPWRTLRATLSAHLVGNVWFFRSFADFLEISPEGGRQRRNVTRVVCHMGLEESHVGWEPSSCQEISVSGKVGLNSVGVCRFRPKFGRT